MLLAHFMRPGSQTIGEEYTDIWLHSTRNQRRPSPRLRAALILLPTLPSYLLSRWGSLIPQTSKTGALLRKIPTTLEVLSEINLALFYLRGTYYGIVKRLLGLRYVSMVLSPLTSSSQRSHADLCHSGEPECTTTVVCSPGDFAGRPTNPSRPQLHPHALGAVRQRAIARRKEQPWYGRRRGHLHR